MIIPAKHPNREGLRLKVKEWMVGDNNMSTS